MWLSLRPQYDISSYLHTHRMARLHVPIVLVQAAVVIAANPRSAGAELLDYDALVAHMEVRAALAHAGNTYARIIVSVLTDDNLKFYDMHSVTAPDAHTPRDVVFSPSYASGSVFLTSHLDALLPQTFFNGSIARTLLALAAAIPVHAHVALVRIPDKYSHATYHDLALMLVAMGAVPLGLYRPAGTKHGTAPYVAANPRPATIVQDEDRVYVLAQPGLLASLV